MLKLFMKNRKGFTLVELMVVVVILGILTSIAVPVYNSVQDKAKTNAIAANVRIIEGAIAMYQANTDSKTALTITPTTTDADNPLVPEYIKKWPAGPDTTKYSVTAGVVSTAP